MEEGSLRCEPNLSLRRRGDRALGVKTEIKNLNSFRAVEQALHYEGGRQKGILEAGGRIRPETLSWDPAARVTRPMRGKEGVHDYRYFPEPDIPGVEVTADWIEEVRTGLPELPRARRDRFRQAYGLSSADAGVLTEDRNFADFFEACVGIYPSPREVSNFLRVELRGLIRERKITLEALPLGPPDIANLLKALAEGEMNPSQARLCLRDMAETAKGVDAVRRKMGLKQIRDEETLSGVVESVVARHPDFVADYGRGRKERAVGFLMGRIMEETAGSADPKRARALLEAALRRAVSPAREDPS
jgi:aspartyl-tRNA(Asn)/glutamyl-tRNA(Gln) amidotransferase subunit B